MQLLHELDRLQKKYSYLPEDEIKALAVKTGVSQAEIIGIASFYQFFTFARDTENHIENIYPCRKKGKLLSGDSRAWVALKKAEQFPESIIPAIREAGLLGRSGGGFPVADKWEITKNAGGSEKYVVCNADEGELFTGKDRVLLTLNPETVIEGMAICAAAVGARKGFIYLRAEYEDLRGKLETVIAEAPLGEFEIEVYMGHGAYVCGEETSLLNSLEGKRGESRLKPPYPGVSGFRGKPTVVNNVESFACVPCVLTGDGCGTRLYTVCGAVKAPGVYEMEDGTSIGELLDAAGGSVCDISAIQIGGGSGSILSSDHMDLSLTNSTCAAAGIALGTSSVRFIGRDESLLSDLTTLMKFFAGESCGTCTPCRVGLAQLVRLLERAESGDAYPEDIEKIKELAGHIRQNARCALGKAAVTPVLSVMENFPEVFA